MNKFIEQTCQICSQKFEEKNSIVVCPECGTPYHKECFEKEQRCIFEEKHNEGYTYVPDVSLLNVVICTKCGKKNQEKHEVCEFCGSNLGRSIPAFSADRILKKLDVLEKDEKNTESNSNEAQDKVEDELIEQFIVRNVDYFKKAFAGEKKFNFCAFLFPAFYYFYRKMYKVGSIFFILFLFLFYVIIKQIKICVSAIEPYISSLNLKSANFFDIVKETTIIIKNSDLDTLLKRCSEILLFSLILILILLFYSGFEANRIYKNHICRKINKYKNLPKESYQKLLFIIGGVNIGNAILAFFSFFFYAVFILLQLFTENPG